MDLGDMEFLAVIPAAGGIGSLRRHAASGFMCGPDLDLIAVVTRNYSAPEQWLPRSRVVASRLQSLP